MAKGKYEYWLTEDGLLLLSAWARDGLTDEQIALKCDICRSTLSEWKIKYPDISDALKKGKEVVDIEVENALLKAALAGEAWAVCFWLKNRKPDAWRDKPEVLQLNINNDNNQGTESSRLLKALLDDNTSRENGPQQ